MRVCRGEAMTRPSKVLPRRHPSDGEPLEEESTYHSPVRCRKFMDWVKKKRCCHCQEPGPNDPAHVGGLREGKEPEFQDSIVQARARSLLVHSRNEHR